MKLIMTRNRVKRIIDVSSSSFVEVDSYARLMAKQGWEITIKGIRKCIR